MNEDELTQDAHGINDGIRDIARTLRSMSADIVRLVLVETRLFGHTVLAMIALTVAIAILLVGVWLFTGAALVMILSSLQSINLTGALLIVALGHLVLAGLTFWRLRHITRDLTFRESRASVNSLLNHARSQVDAGGQPPQNSEQG